MRAQRATIIFVIVVLRVGLATLKHSLFSFQRTLLCVKLLSAGHRILPDDELEWWHDPKTRRVGSRRRLERSARQGLKHSHSKTDGRKAADEDREHQDRSIQCHEITSFQTPLQLTSLIS